MTPDEFVEALEIITLEKSYDVEVAHWEADRLLCKVLRALGYDEGIDIFENLEKWYA